MMSPLLVFLGGGLGALLRYVAGRGALALGQPPYASTLFVNLVGCFVMGLVAGVATHRGMTEPTRLFMMAGVLGGFTTFSAFSLDALTMMQRGALASALAYAAVSLVGCLAGVSLGYALVRAT